MISKLLQRIEFNFMPSFILIMLPLLWFIYNYELVYLLNDEIIFDCVLLLLVIYINSLLSTSNLKVNFEEQKQFCKLSIFILYYLVTFRYLVLRKKKHEQSNLIAIVRYLDGLQSDVFSKYTSKVYSNIINDIKDHLLYKLRTIISMKRVELVHSVQHSYREKLFILI